jgi:uncharacterized integral membrane protein
VICSIISKTLLKCSYKFIIEGDFMRLGFILSLIFGVFITIFALQNAEAVSINFLFADFQMSQALVILLSAIFGALIVTLLGLYREISMKFKTKQQTKLISQLEKENSLHKEKIEELENINNKEISKTQLEAVESLAESTIENSDLHNEDSSNVDLTK